MLGAETVISLVSQNGLAIVAPIAVVEGPIVTVIGAWLASRGVIDFWSLAAVVIVADLIGDILFYGLGRYGIKQLPRRWKARMGLYGSRMRNLVGHFVNKGGRTLALGKITHSAGAAVLVAAGAARMNFGRFLIYNFAATVPKSMAFLVIGYSLGAAYARIDDWIARGSLYMGAVIVAVSAVVLVKRIRR